jgi:hypothetical protein
MDMETVSLGEHFLAAPIIDILDLANLDHRRVQDPEVDKLARPKTAG